MENCPACEREFKGIEDYPLIYVVDFKREEFPEAISGSRKKLYYPGKNKRGVSTVDEIPIEVLHLFEETEKDLIVYEGKVWEKTTAYGAVYQSSDEIASDKFREAYENPKLQDYLDSLEDFVGRESKTSNILPEWERNKHFGVYLFRKKSGLEKEGDGLVFKERDVSGGHSVAFHEEGESGNYRSSNINLMGDGLNLGSAGGPTLTTLMTLGTLTYEGRINTLQPTE